MKLYVFSSSTPVLVLSLLWAVCGVQAATKTTGPAGANNRVWVVPAVEIPQSVFAPATNPKEGRNPFFPRSAVVPDPVKPGPAPQVDTSALVLNGITSPPKSTAMINGRTFEAGEEGEVHLPGGGKEMIKVEQIKNDSAVIFVRGERRELRLRSGI
jgi:hypothetical protein